MRLAALCWKQFGNKALLAERLGSNAAAIKPSAFAAENPLGYLDKPPTQVPRLDQGTRRIFSIEIRRFTPAYV